MRALRSLARSALALAAALAITVCSAAPAAAIVVEPEEPVGSERAAATVHPALVRVTGTFVGRVHDREGGYANNGQPYTFVYTCSGFGVHPDGYIATVAHCIDANDSGVRELFIRTAAEELVASSPDVTLGDMIVFGQSAWDIEGETPGSPIASQIVVSGIAGAPPEGMLARVVDDRPSGQGDVGLLKVDTTGLPAVELATGPGLAVGTRLIAAGYAENVGDRVAAGATPSIKQGAIDGSTTDGGRPFYRMDADVDAGMSGGPAFDDSGRALGINNVRTNGDVLYNLVTPISAFADLLGRNGVRAELGPRDLRYREALDAYYRGEYTDVIEAVDRLRQDGRTHPRIAELRRDAEADRELHGDASENRLTQILVWGSVGMGAVVIVVVGVLLVVRRRRRQAVVMVPPPPFPGPYGRPAGPMPPSMWQQGPPPRAPRQPYGPAHHRPPVAPQGRPPQPPASFDGPTRAITVRRPASPGSDEPENRTVTITPPPTTVPERTDPAGADQEDAPKNA
jgi:serine protease Do